LLASEEIAAAAAAAMVSRFCRMNQSKRRSRKIKSGDLF
jgi:hypothetical protein